MTKLKPCNIITTAADVEAATAIIADPKNYIVRYLRHNPTVGLKLVQPRNTDGAIIVDANPVKQRVICQGVPFACMIAFMYEDRLRIGWSKRIEEPKMVHTSKGFLPDLVNLFGDALATFFDCKQTPESELPYSKSEGRLVAVIRGLKDLISFDGKQAFSAASGPMPSDLARSLPQFIEYVESVYGGEAFNVDKDSMPTTATKKEELAAATT